MLWNVPSPVNGRDGDLFMGKRPPQGDGDQQAERNTIIVEDEVLRAGFTQIPNLLLRREDISPGAKLTYMVLLSYAWQTDSCFPGHDRLATDMGVAKRSIVTYLQQLRDQGLIRIERRGLGQTNVYRLPKLSDSVPDPRSAKFALQEVQKTTPLEVQNLQPNKDSVKEYPDRNKSNIRLTSRSKKVKQADSPPGSHASETDHDVQPEAPTEASPDHPELHQTGFIHVGALLPQIALQTAPTTHSAPSQGASGAG
ncbi:MAG: helix-turn-helix domain-containing protein, partial [Acidobacteriota bacterium]|nr:helix-turn-helix domain-containing protein [Acidobacteriota bacterium]